MKQLWIYCIAAIGACIVDAAAASPGSSWRSLIALPTAGTEDEASLGGLDRFVIGAQLGDVRAVEAALADSTWSPHLRAWARARWARSQGDRDVAARAYADAARAWPRTLEEVPAVLAVFDRERLALALEQGDLEAARGIAAAPLRAHEDPAWEAGLAGLRLRDGDANAALAAFDAAWERADRVARRDVAFAGRALAHLATADTVGAGGAWIDYVRELRRPERQRSALATWDREPGLALAVARAPERKIALDWLVRLFRRDEARRLASTWLEGAAPAEAGELFVFVAEQLYRLREHDVLFAWLGRTWPDSLDVEQRAALESYPWGVRRRGGHGEDIALAFDAIADRYRPSARAAEARWEAAWMWELSEREDVAVARYEQYLDERPDGPFASAAALRAIFLRWRAGDFAGAAAAYQRHRLRLDDGLDGASGQWLAARSLDQLGQVEEAAALRAQLRRDHPASPMWREALDTTAGQLDPEARLRAFAKAQEHAWETLAEHLGVESLDPLDDEALRSIDRLAELGLFTEAESQLAEWADARRGDTLAIARGCALAHRRGLPEMQGRYGWILERRLRDAGDGVGQAALVASLPTPFARTVLELGRDLDLAPELIWALMRRESFYDADVLSIAGAYGLLQLIPRTAEEMATRIGVEVPTPQELFVPAVNLRLGASYLAGLLRESSGDRIRALASYNAGETNGVRWQERRRPGEPDPVGILVISYSETRAYAYHVQRLWNLYADAYGGAAP